MLGLVNVLDFCVRQKAALGAAELLCVRSSASLPIAEDHSLRSLNPYSLTKILAEQTAQFYEQRFGLALVIVRPFNLYGPGQRDSFLIPSIVRQVLDPSAEVLRLADLRPKRDYVYVTDAVELLLATLRPGVHGVFNVGSGHSVSVAEVAELVMDAAGIRKEVASADEPRPGEIMDVVADTSRAAADLDWRPRTSLGDGIAAVVAAERAGRG